MEAINLLRRVLQQVPAPQSGLQAQRRRLPPHELRFVLEYFNRPDRSSQVAAIRTLLGVEGFCLEPLTGDPGPLDRFLVLRFPYVERTLVQRDLFEIGYAFADALHLASAEPDLGTDFYADPELHPERPEIESAAIAGLCWVNGDAPPDHRWALRNAGILDAWAKSRGEGIVIAQPDTGIAKHDEIDGSMLALEHAADIIDGDPDPTDPLTPGTANPGHGTGTASVLASPEAGLVAGAAPRARIAPIRCIEDVKVFNAAPVAAAIAHAVAKKCHVVSMSLGGVPSRALHEAVRAAVAADMIVVAAAGNCVRLVVWPARYDEVIAVAGNNVVDRPWKGSSRGAAVDICAPGEFVWRAQRQSASDPTSVVSGGQGTSFATALVAGVAALWLAHHGREEAIKEARRRNTSVQRLFRSALRASARRPENWDVEDFGPGIANAAELLDIALAEIPAVAHEAVGAPGSSVRRLLDEEIGPGVSDGAFPWQRYEAEIATISLSQAKLGASVASLSPEAKVQSTRPSPQLSAAAAASGDSRLARFSEAPGKTTVARPLVRQGAPAGPRLVQLAMPAKTAGLESAGGVFLIDKARQYLQGQGRKEVLDRLEAIMNARAHPDAALRSKTLDDVDRAIGAIAGDQPLSREALVGLETLVKLNGRPAVRLRNGVIDVEDPRASEWHDRLFLLQQDPRFEKRTQSVGRIDVDGVHMGTGFVVGQGRVLTNRHVLQTFAAPVPRRNDPQGWVMTADTVTIDFADEPSSATAASRFRIKGVIGAGPSDIEEDLIDFTDLDAALLEVETSNAAGNELPGPVGLVRDMTKADARRQIFVVGYPARPASLPRTESGSIDEEVAKRLGVLFGSDYGAKYLSPGEVALPAGGLSGDTRAWTITHDATTLGGSSGSCVIGFDEPVSVVGLHFGGSWMRENYAHAVAALARDGNFLTDPALRWIP